MSGRRFLAATALAALAIGLTLAAPARADEAMIEGLSFAALRRVATMIKVPAEGSRAIEMISIGSVDLSDAQRIDASAPDD